MKYRSLGKTDLVVSEVGFGVWTLSTDWWGRIEERDGIMLINEALDLGINFFDTADSYSHGYGEEIITKSIGKKRNNLIIGTKFGYDFYTSEQGDQSQERPQNFSPSFVRYACEQSLRRLNTDYIDIYQIHHPNLDMMENDDLFEILESLINEGKIRYYGYSLNSSTDWSQEWELSIRERNPHSVQMVYNILEQEPAISLFPIAAETTAGLLSRAPHASGILDGTYDAYSRSPHMGDVCMETSLKKLHQLDFLTQETDATLGQIAIQFALAQPYIASVLPDITNHHKLREFALSPETPQLDKESLYHAADLYDHNFYI